MGQFCIVLLHLHVDGQRRSDLLRLEALVQKPAGVELRLLNRACPEQVALAVSWVEHAARDRPLALTESVLFEHLKRIVEVNICLQYL